MTAHLAGGSKTSEKEPRSLVVADAMAFKGIMVI